MPRVGRTTRARISIAHRDETTVHKYFINDTVIIFFIAHMPRPRHAPAVYAGPGYWAAVVFAAGVVQCVVNTRRVGLLSRFFLNEERVNLVKEKKKILYLK